MASDKYQGKLPCLFVKFKCKCRHVSISSNSKHICTKRPKVELCFLNLKSFRYIRVGVIPVGGSELILIARSPLNVVTRHSQ